MFLGFSRSSKLIKPSLSLSLVFLVSPGYLLVCIICFLILSPFPFLCIQHLLCIVELLSTPLSSPQIWNKSFRTQISQVVWNFGEWQRMAGEANEEKPINQQLEELWTQNGEKRGVPQGIRRLLNTAFTNVQVSSFPDLPSGKVVEIPGDSSIAQAVQTLAENNIFSAPVTNPEASPTDSWAARYKGVVDYPSIILWVLEQAEMAAASFAAGSAAAVGMGAGAFGALGAIVLGLTGPVAIAGLATAAVGAAIAGGIAAERGLGKDPSAAADALGEDFYKVILQEEPFKSTQVVEITKSYRWAPFLPIEPDESMLTVLLLLSKFRLRSIPVVNDCDPDVKNVITQSAVIQGLSQCRGRDWFDSLAGKSLFQIGLPVMSPDQMVSVDANQLVLEAFILMKEKGIGGLPVVEGPEKKLKGNISVRDVRYLLLQPDLFAHRRELTIAEFMKTVKWIAPAETGLMPPITCEKTSKLGDVIETLSSKNIHRIYVVDKGSQVAGVITLRDIIGCFVSEPEGYFDNYFGGAFKETIQSEQVLGDDYVEQDEADFIH